MVPPRFLVGVPVPLEMEQRLWHKAMQAAAAAAMAAIWQPGVLPRGFSCAGTEAAITALKEFAEKAGAPKAKILKTGGAFHTSMMQPAQDKQGKVLDDLAPTMKPPRATVYMNSTAGPIKPDTSPQGDRDDDDDGADDENDGDGDGDDDDDGGESGGARLKSEALPVARNIGHPTTSLHSSSRQRYPVCPH